MAIKEIISEIRLVTNPVMANPIPLFEPVFDILANDTPARMVPVRLVTNVPIQIGGKISPARFRRRLEIPTIIDARPNP